MREKGARVEILYLQVNVRQLQLESGKMISASRYGQQDEVVEIQLTDAEKEIASKIKVGYPL